VTLSVLSKTGNEAVLAIFGGRLPRRGVPGRSAASHRDRDVARTLLLVARYGKQDTPARMPRLSQGVLADMVGTTRSRVSFFKNRFRNLGFIESNGGFKINRSLLSGALHD
jgi:CRP-like cAMP-binding protein